MKKHIILGLFSLALTATTALCGTISTVLVSTNQLVIPYTGAYAANRLVKLGNYTLPWTQAGKSSNIVATLPTNIPAGTYALALQGSTTVNVEIGSVTAAAALNARVDAETARAGNAEASLTNGINAEVTRATAAEADLTDDLNAETTRATGSETGLTNSINAETTRAENAEADLANSINGNSNSIVASVASNINTASNNIVASLTKNFTSAFAFGFQGVSNNTPVTFSNFIGDWETNSGTAFKIPASGVYQISVSINVDGRVSPGYYDTGIQITGSNNSSTNGLAYFHYTYGTRATVSGQTTIYCTQDDLISVQSTGAFSFGYNDPTNIPSATLSIIQIQ